MEPPSRLGLFCNNMSSQPGGDPRLAGTDCTVLHRFMSVAGSEPANRAPCRRSVPAPGMPAGNRTSGMAVGRVTIPRGGTVHLECYDNACKTALRDFTHAGAEDFVVAEFFYSELVSRPPPARRADDILPEPTFSTRPQSTTSDCSMEARRQTI